MKMGADLITIGKAKSYSLYMKKLLSAEPTMDIQDKYVRLFYEPNELKKAQNTFNNMLKPGTETDIKIDYLPVMLPVLLKKYSLQIALSLIAFYLISKKL